MSNFNESDWIRVKGGVAGGAGGQFEGRVQSAADAGAFPAQRPSLDDLEVATDLSPSQRAHAERAKALAEGGFVEAVAYRKTVGNVGDADDKRPEWWDAKRVSAEYDADGGAYAQMPDDYTPSNTAYSEEMRFYAEREAYFSANGDAEGAARMREKISALAARDGGQAMSGSRRTHRMRYSGSGMDIRMPSKAAVHRFAREGTDGNPVSTFDVPISATYTDAEGNRTEVDGWMRVTKMADGSGWYCEPKGFPDHPHAEAYAEGVSAVLESRRVSGALNKTGDLIEKSRQRRAAAGEPLAPVRSEWLSKAAIVDGALVVETQPYTYKRDNPAKGIRAGDTRAGQVHSWTLSADEEKALRSGEIMPGSMASKKSREAKGQTGVAVTRERCGNCSKFYSPTRGHQCREHSGPTGQQYAYNQAARQRAVHRLLTGVVSKGWLRSRT